MSPVRGWPLHPKRNHSAEGVEISTWCQPGRLSIASNDGMLPMLTSDANGVSPDPNPEGPEFLQEYFHWPASSKAQQCFIAEVVNCQFSLWYWGHSLRRSNEFVRFWEAGFPPSEKLDGYVSRTNFDDQLPLKGSYLISFNKKKGKVKIYCSTILDRLVLKRDEPLLVMASV